MPELVSNADISLIIEQYLNPTEIITIDGLQYGQKSLEWQNLCINALEEEILTATGFKSIQLHRPTVEQILAITKDLPDDHFYVVNPLAKSIESINTKLQNPIVRGYADIYDFLRCSIIPKNKEHALALTNACRQIIHSTNLFLPLSKFERTLKSHVVPEENTIGDRRNKATISDLLDYLDAHPEEYGLNMRCQTGQGFQNDEVPQSLRMEIRIVTAGLHAQLNRDSSSFSHSRYRAQRTQAYADIK